METIINPIDIIIKDRPTLRPTTVATYERHLKQLKILFDAENYDFLKEPDIVIDKIKTTTNKDGEEIERPYLQQRNLLNAIIVVLRALNSDKSLTDIIDKYVIVRDKYNQDYKDIQKTGIISDKQKPNQTTTEEIYEMIEKMRTELLTVISKDYTKKQFALFQAYTFFNIYVRLPLRNDISGMRLIKSSDFKKLKAEDKVLQNYLVYNKSKFTFVLNDYKTFKINGEQTTPVEDKELRRILRLYININWNKDNEFLFTSSTGKMISRNDLSKILIKYSKKYMNGKSVSTVMLRKAYMDKYKPIKEEMEKDSKILGHNVSTTGMNVYVKNSE